jgi:hypothetical protein
MDIWSSCIVNYENNSKFTQGSSRKALLLANKYANYVAPHKKLNSQYLKEQYDMYVLAYLHGNITGDANFDAFEYVGNGVH